MYFKAAKCLKNVNGDKIFSIIFMQNQVNYNEIYIALHIDKKHIWNKEELNLFTDALETFHVLICQPGFTCSSGFDAPKAADFPQH